MYIPNYCPFFVFFTVIPLYVYNILISTIIPKLILTNINKLPKIVYHPQDKTVST